MPLDAVAHETMSRTSPRKRSRRALAIRHVAFEDLGIFEKILLARGYEVEYRGIGELDFNPLAPDLLVILGGPIGVYEDKSYPFIKTELKLLETRLKAEKPALGICLGCQLMAKALGARVYPGGKKEIGFAPLILAANTKDHPVEELHPSKTNVLHWHGDTFDLPKGSSRLASSALYPNQAFEYGKNALGLQFHPEVAKTGLEHWFVGHSAEIAHTQGISVEGLRRSAGANCPRLARAGKKFFDRWLDRAGL